MNLKTSLWIITKAKSLIYKQNGQNKTKARPTTKILFVILKLIFWNELDPVSLTVPHNDLWPPLKKQLN